MPAVLILGCGFTGERVARRFLERGASVTVTTRDPQRLAHLSALGATVISLEALAAHLRPGMLVLHSIPSGGPADAVVERLGNAPGRVVYLSTTAVYGTEGRVDETTPADASNERARVRIATEQAIAAGPWSTLILRPAAIYGPGRGVQVSLPLAEYHAGENYVSRIHVDDLAAHAEAGMLASLTGAFPVADEQPCTSREIAGFCAELLGLPALPVASAHAVARITSNRRVDGSAIRRLLGLALQYPSYRTGIPASLGGMR